MDCFQAVNYGISLGEKILEDKLLELPTSYRDIFDTLSKNGLVDKETRNAFIRAIHLRNVIAHQYDDLKDDDVKEIVTLMPALKKFAEKHLK